MVTRRDSFAIMMTKFAAERNFVRSSLTYSLDTSYTFAKVKQNNLGGAYNYEY